MNSILDLSLDELGKLLADWNEPSYRALQLWHGIYKLFWFIPDQFSDIPKPVRQRLFDEFCFNPLKVVNKTASNDRMTMKFLFELPDGNAIESVLMAYKRGYTLCLSTQVGCAMQCAFCATGQMGFTRHLSSGEIIAQVLFFARLLAHENKSLSNIVYMGMGEPFHNYENTISSIERINDACGYNYGSRRITISTVGLLPEMEKFFLEKIQVNLAISLHAADNSIRASLLPISNVYPLHELIFLCKKYINSTRRRLSFEWVLIDGVNDTMPQAKLLSECLSGLTCHVNLIPLNPTPYYAGKPSTSKKAKLFKDELVKNGINCTFRLDRGNDIRAGCGQLFTKRPRQ